MMLIIIKMANRAQYNQLKKEKLIKTDDGNLFCMTKLKDNKFQMKFAFILSTALL